MSRGVTLASRSDDHLPTASIEHLKARAELLVRLRAFFAQRDFWEVETPLLSADSVVDLHIEPICVSRSGQADSWLQTSPEFGMKRLVSAGAEAIFQVAKCFRDGESGPLHNLEFTMVEWYRAGDDYQTGMRLLADLASSLLSIDRQEFVTYDEAFQSVLGIDAHSADVDELTEVAMARGLSVDRGFSQSRDDWLDLLLSQCVQPTLSADCATILYDYPVSQAALAKIRAGEAPRAERFELFVSGVELANGYHELVDADELRRRNDATNRLRREQGKRALPSDSRLLAAMESGLPGCCGCALGFDRLAMLALGATSIDNVIAFPASRA
jgi:elongation factor P--(R)-beta-lysine ligase